MGIEPGWIIAWCFWFPSFNYVIHVSHRDIHSKDRLLTMRWGEKHDA
jgi:hypothetical protein